MASLNSLNNLMDIGRNQRIEKVNGQGHLANKGQSPERVLLSLEPCFLALLCSIISG